jgi:hypothetical protein
MPQEAILPKQTQPGTVTTVGNSDDSQLTPLTAISDLGDSTPSVFTTKTELLKQKNWSRNDYFMVAII